VTYPQNSIKRESKRFKFSWRSAAPHTRRRSLPGGDEFHLVNAHSLQNEGRVISRPANVFHFDPAREFGVGSGMWTSFSGRWSTPTTCALFRFVLLPRYLIAARRGREWHLQLLMQLKRKNRRSQC
jgi:hypothetical protein